MRKNAFIFRLLSFDFRLLTFVFLLCSIPSFGRVICDTACHASEDEFRNYAGVYMVYVAGYKGVACKVVKNRTAN